MTIDIRSRAGRLFPVIHALRPHLSRPAELIERGLRQFDRGYHLLAAWSGDVVVGTAGYRCKETLPN